MEFNLTGLRRAFDSLPESERLSMNFGVIFGIMLLVCCVGTTGYLTFERYVGVLLKFIYVKVRNRIHRKAIAKEKIQEGWELAMALVPGTPITKRAAEKIRILLPHLESLPPLDGDEDKKKQGVIERLSAYLTRGSVSTMRENLILVHPLSEESHDQCFTS